LYGDTRLGHLGAAPALPVEVDWWFENDPEINLGVIPGFAAKLLIADVDALDLFGPELVTPTVSSGRKAGGRHFYFAGDREVKMQRMPWGHVNPPYALLPGSVHPSGRVYEWLPDRSPKDVPFMSFEQATGILGVEIEASGE
jgi:hypothetical protein